MTQNLDKGSDIEKITVIEANRQLGPDIYGHSCLNHDHLEVF